METKVSFVNKNGEKLIGLKATPDNPKEKNPTMILVHGFAYYKEEAGMFDGLAKTLSENEIIAYRFDLSGCGESEGDFRNSTLTSMTEEVQEIIDYVKKDPQVDTERLGLLGQSFGTTVIMALHPEAKCVVLLGTVSHPQERIAELFGEHYDPEGKSWMERENGSITVVKPAFWKDLKKYDLSELVKEIKCPILFVHGEKDEMIPVSDMEDAYAAANEPKEKALIKDSDHGMEPGREEMYEIVTEWTKNKLNA